MMKVKMNADIAGCYRDFDFEIEKGTVCNVIEIKENVVYVEYEDEIATVYARYVDFL